MTGYLKIEMRGRSRGSLTGSRTAGAAARIPVECSVCECAARSGDKGFNVGAANLTYATYIDNVFSASSCASNAISLLDELAEVLWSKWQLNIKASSREVIVAQGSGCRYSSIHAWKQVTVLECLGHFISDSCSINLIGTEPSLN